MDINNLYLAAGVEQGNLPNNYGTDIGPKRAATIETLISGHKDLYKASKLFSEAWKRASQANDLWFDWTMDMKGECTRGEFKPSLQIVNPTAALLRRSFSAARTATGYYIAGHAKVALGHLKF